MQKWPRTYPLALRTSKNQEKKFKNAIQTFCLYPMNLLWMNFQEDRSKNEKVISFLDHLLAIFHINTCIIANFCAFRNRTKFSWKVFEYFLKPQKVDFSFKHKSKLLWETFFYPLPLVLIVLNPRIKTIGGVGVIFACEAYKKVPIKAESMLFTKWRYITIWIFRHPYFPVVKFHKKWPLTSAIQSYKSILHAFEP